MDSQLLQRVLLQICLHDVHLRHAVGYGRSRGKHHALVSAALFADILDLHLHIARPRARRVRDARYVVHLCVQKKIFVRIRFVHEQIIHAQIFKDEHVVLFARVGQFFQHLFPTSFDPLQILDR